MKTTKKSAKKSASKREPDFLDEMEAEHKQKVKANTKAKKTTNQAKSGQNNDQINPLELEYNFHERWPEYHLVHDGDFIVALDGAKKPGQKRFLKELEECAENLEQRIRNLNYEIDEARTDLGKYVSAYDALKKFGLPKVSKT